MRLHLTVFLFFVFFLCCNYNYNKENIQSNEILNVIKKHIDREKCFVENRDKFVSMIFYKTNKRIIVQVCTYTDRPFKDENLFYYKEDSDYIFVCTGFCDNFVQQNGFQKWNDSIDKRYLKFWYLLEHDDFAFEFYTNHNNFNSEFYEYNNNFIPLDYDSLSYDEQDSIFSQSIRFDMGFCTSSPLPQLLNTK